MVHPFSFVSNTLLVASRNKKTRLFTQFRLGQFYKRMSQHILSDPTINHMDCFISINASPRHQNSAYKSSNDYGLRF